MSYIVWLPKANFFTSNYCFIAKLIDCIIHCLRQSCHVINWRQLLLMREKPSSQNLILLADAKTKQFDLRFFQLIKSKGKKQWEITQSSHNERLSLLNIMFTKFQIAFFIKTCQLALTAQVVARLDTVGQAARFPYASQWHGQNIPT